jgi:hypothetical protein
LERTYGGLVLSLDLDLGILCSLVSVASFLASAKAAGPLSVGSTNPRFFVDSNGKAVYLTATVNEIVVHMNADRTILATPTQSSNLYAGAFTLKNSAVVKAIAFKNGSNPRVQASASFTIAAPSAAQLTSSWQDNSNNEDDFAIERKTGSNGTYAQIAMVAANVGSYVDNNVTRGVAYCYRVDAINSAGASNYTNETCATVP